MNDLEYMNIAVKLAKKGVGFVSPNPLVGAIIVKNEHIIGSGYHESYGGRHAEINAILSLTQSAQGATMYVTLEPCCHYGKTPPCISAIIEQKIARVVIGTKDLNPLVGGKGIEVLRQNGIDVTEGILERECKLLNEVFFHFIQTGMPFVMMKFAMTVDGKTASYTGKSKWITSNLSREEVQHQRLKYSSIMVGINTVITDNPELSYRLPNGRNPTRIICDTHLKIPIKSKVIAGSKEILTIIATGSQDNDKLNLLLERGCKIIQTPLKNGHIDLNFLMKRLGKMNIDSILLEGGGTLNFSALESGIVNRVQAYIAPKIMGGFSAKTPVDGFGIEDPNNAIRLERNEIKFFGDDIMIEYEVIK